MGFKLQDLIQPRPYAHHLTSRDNLRRLRRTGRMDCAAELIRMAERTDLLWQLTLASNPFVMEIHERVIRNLQTEIDCKTADSRGPN